MKTDKEEYVAVYEHYIQELIRQQAQMVIEISELEDVLIRHRKDSITHHLEYDYDHGTGIYSYTKGKKKKIGF